MPPSWKDFDTRCIHVDGVLEEIVARRELLYGALRPLTTDESKAIWDSTYSKDGFEAWHRLCLHFEPNVNAQATRASMEVVNMGREKAKSIAETRKLTALLDERMRRLTELTGQ